MLRKIASFGSRLGTRFRRIATIYAEIVRRRTMQLLGTKRTYPFVALILATLVNWLMHLFQNGTAPFLTFQLWWVSTLLLASTWLIGIRSLRKNARRSLGRFGFICAICAGTFGVLLSVTKTEPTATWTSAAGAPLAENVYLIALVWLSTFLFAMGLAVALRIASAVFASVFLRAQIGRFRIVNLVSAPSLFALCIVAWGLAWSRLILGESNSTSETIVPLGIVTTIAMVEILLRYDPWRRSIPNFPALLPHSQLLVALPFLLHGIDLRNEDLYLSSIVLAFLLILSGWVIRFLYWMLVGLRIDLVSAEATAGAESWLSTQPDAATYVPSDYAHRVLDYIERANSGVIGVTGVRGAGKSALFKHALQQCAVRFGRLEMTAPVAYERGTQSLMTLCRELAQRVIRDVEPALHGRPSTTVLAMRDLARRVPALLIVMIGGIGLIAYGTSLTYQQFDTTSSQSAAAANPSDLRGTFTRDASYPRSVRIWPTNEVFGDHPYLPATLAATRRSEAAVISDVLTNAKRVLQLMQPKENDASTRFISGALFAPAARSGFTFAPVSTEKPPKNLHTLSSNWSPKIPLKFNNSERSEFMFSRYVFPSFRYSRYMRSKLDLISKDEIADLYYFRYHVSGFKLEDEIRFSNKFEHFSEIFISLDLIRGDLSLESRFAANTHSLRELLNNVIARRQKTQRNEGPETGRDEAEAAPQRPTQFASLLLLDAWRRQPEGVFFTADDLGRLIVLLEEYLTLFPGTTQAVAANAAAATSSAYSDWDQWARQHWPAIAVAALLLLIYPIFRSTILILRGLVNFRYVGLMREAESFLGYLAFSESQERSVGWSFRGFKFGGRRTVTARALTLESLTARYLDFVQIILPHYNNKVIIVIDELDKVVDPTQVRDFLLELKGALFGRGCFYLISISEDAARAFRGRLAEGRDIFESTFDYIVEIDRMDPQAAAGMIEKRLEKSPKAPKFSDDAILLLTAFGGGIPREVIRHFANVSLDSRFAKRVSPRRLAPVLFTAVLDEWEDQLPESYLAGKEIVAMRTDTENIKTAISQLGARDPWPPKIGGHLRQFLATVDPEQLYLTNAEDTNDEANQDRVRIVLKEVQRVVWLMILDEVMADFWNRNSGWRDTARQALDAAVVLPDKPALALAVMDLLPPATLQPSVNSGSTQSA